MTWTRAVIAVMLSALVIVACDPPPSGNGVADPLADLIDAPSATSSLDRVAPDNVTTLFENRHVSIMRLTLPPGSRISAHASGPRAIYALKDGELTIVDGETRRVRLYDEGDADIWRTGDSALLNSGQSELELLVATRSETDLPEDTAPESDQTDADSSGTDIRDLVWNDDFRISKMVIPTGEQRRVVCTHPFVVHSLAPIFMKVDGDDGKAIDIAAEPRQTVWFDAYSNPVLTSSDCPSQVVIFEFNR